MDSAALTLSLFSHGWLYFNNRSLQWDGSRHTVAAPEIRGEEIVDLIAYVNTECGPTADLNDICSMALKGMQAVAEAVAPCLPRSEIASELAAMLPDGDIAGISLVPLLHEPKLWSVEQVGTDSYAIEYDGKLADAIPRCEDMLRGIVDALRSVDPVLTGEASYALTRIGGAGAVVEPEPEQRPEPEPAPMPEPEPEDADADEQLALIECDGLVIDLGAHSVTVDGHEASLTRTEYNLLIRLATNPSQPFSRQELFETVRNGKSNTDARAVDSQIKNLRAKLGEDTKRPRFIKTVHGLGYQFIGTVTKTVYASPDNATLESETWRSQNDGRALVIDRASQLAYVDGAAIELSHTEFKTLSTLSSRHGGVWSNEDLSLAVLGIGFEESGRNLATHIKNLRAKLGDAARDPSWIKTVHGVGYKMAGTLAQPDQSAASLEPALAETEDPGAQDERLATKRANEQRAMQNLEFPDFPQELLAVEPDIHTQASRYAVALYVIARVAPDDRPLTLVELRRAVRPYVMAADLKRLSIPSLRAACEELSARGLARIEADAEGEIARVNVTRLAADDALRIAREFDVHGPYDSSLQPSAMPSELEPVHEADPETASEPEPESMPALEPESTPVPEPAPGPDPERLAELDSQIAQASEKLAALDPAPLQAKLDGLVRERASLGIFKFSAKKELGRQIELIRQGLDELARKDADREQLKELLADLTRQRDDMLNIR